MSEQVLHPHQFKPVYHGPAGSARVTPSGYIMNVQTRSDQRGHGHARALMNDITADADRLGKTLSLHARPELHSWYASHGFEVDKSSAGQIEQTVFGQPYLVRKPQQQ